MTEEKAKQTNKDGEKTTINMTTGDNELFGSVGISKPNTTKETGTSPSTLQKIWTEESLVADLLEARLRIPEEPLGEKLKKLRLELNNKKIAYEGVTVRMYRFGSEKDPQVDAAIKEFIDVPVQQLSQVEVNKPEMDEYMEFSELMNSIRTKKWSSSQAGVIITPVDRTLPWIGGEKVTSMVQKVITNDVQSHLKKETFKNAYQYGVISGGTGIGKTRGCLEAVPLAVQRLAVEFANNDFSIKKPSSLAHRHLFIDLSRGDAKSNMLDGWTSTDLKTNQSADVSIGMRIAARYFLNDDLNSLIALVNPDQYFHFSLKNVLTLIGAPFKQKNQLLLLTIQIDEFQKFEQGQMTLAMGTAMSTLHELGVVIVPFLTGTGQKMLDELNTSRFKGVELILEPCQDEDSKQMIKHSLQLGETYKQFESRILEDAIMLCGNIPRLNEFLVKAVNNFVAKKNILVGFSVFMKDVQAAIVLDLQSKYDSADWDAILRKQGKGHFGDGIATMCLYALTHRSLTLLDKLNGFTVEDAKNGGVIYLKAVDPTAQLPRSDKKYFVTVPLALLDYFNTQYHFFDAILLHPYENNDWDSFEQLMMLYRKVMNDLYLKLHRTSVTFTELYGPELLGWKEDLEKTVDIHAFEIVQGLKRTNIATLDECDPHAVPIGDQNTIDFTKCQHFIRNVPKAPSWDAALYHPNTEQEDHQYKSSDFISRGIPPSLKSSNQLDINLLIEEAEKTGNSEEDIKNFKTKLEAVDSKIEKLISEKLTLESVVNPSKKEKDELKQKILQLTTQVDDLQRESNLLKAKLEMSQQRRKFSCERNRILLIISNKPFLKYQKIKTDLSSGQSSFPKGVLLICNNNFENCIGETFYTWKKLFIKAVSTTSCECKDCNNPRCSCKMDNQNCHGDCACSGIHCKRIQGASNSSSNSKRSKQVDDIMDVDS